MERAHKVLKTPEHTETTEHKAFSLIFSCVPSTIFLLMKKSPSKSAPSPEPPTLSVRTQLAFEKWLEKNHQKSQGIWLKIVKKVKGVASFDYAEALESALCYGWIDGQKKPFDETAWLQKFTP